MTTRRRRWDVLLSAALFLLLALLFVPECDDCYFIYWDFASWKDFLLVRPIPQEGVVLGVPSNGRYLGNLLGLVCDPVAGLVEVPCVNRNVMGAVNALSCAEMALSGVESAIPCDEVIDAMRAVGDALPASLRETGSGGLAATPTGRRLAERL